MELGAAGPSFFAFAARLACLVSCSNLRFASSALSISTSMQGVGAAAATGVTWGGEGMEDSDGPAGVLGGVVTVGEDVAAVEGTPVATVMVGKTPPEARRTSMS